MNKKNILDFSFVHLESRYYFVAKPVWGKHVMSVLKPLHVQCGLLQRLRLAPHRFQQLPSGFTSAWIRTELGHRPLVKGQYFLRLKVNFPLK